MPKKQPSPAGAYPLLMRLFMYIFSSARFIARSIEASFSLSYTDIPYATDTFSSGGRSDAAAFFSSSSKAFKSFSLFFSKSNVIFFQTVRNCKMSTHSAKLKVL